MNFKYCLKCEICHLEHEKKCSNCNGGLVRVTLHVCDNCGKKTLPSDKKCPVCGCVAKPGFEKVEYE
jgi:hypothetical protein